MNEETGQRQGFYNSGKSPVDFASLIRPALKGMDILYISISVQRDFGKVMAGPVHLCIVILCNPGNEDYKVPDL